MPIPKPRKMEKKSDFISRCMGDTVMNKDYKEQKQRAAVCYSTWERKKAKASYCITVGSEEYIAYSEESDAAADKPLNKPFRTPSGPKKFSVYVKNDKGNVVKVNFGDPNMEIKRDDPERRKNFRARHNCDNPGPKWKARYWSCRMWSGKSVTKITKGGENASAADCGCGCDCDDSQIDWDNLMTEGEMMQMYPEMRAMQDVAIQEVESDE